MPDRRPDFYGTAVLTPYVQGNSVLVIARRDLRTGVETRWCPVAEPAWDGYVAWPANLPRWLRA